LPFPTPGDLPNPGTKPSFPELADGFFTTDPQGKPKRNYTKKLSETLETELEKTCTGLEIKKKKLFKTLKNKLLKKSIKFNK